MKPNMNNLGAPTILKEWGEIKRNPSKERKYDNG